MIIKKGVAEDTILYTFDRAGLELMQEVKRRGGRCVMEQTVAPFELWRSLLREEQALFPGWEAEWGAGDDLAWFGERERQEWLLADLIICGSDFVRDGIAAWGGPVERCCVIPYGTESVITKIDRQRQRRPGPLRVLTVGEVGLRKGSQYVLEVAKQLQNKAIFKMVGPTSLTEYATHELSKYVELTGQVPRSEIASHFLWGDVFLLPSLLEGSAGVVYEALSSGLPVICTPNTGSVVRDGHNGYIVPIRDTQAVCNRLLELIANPVELMTMSENALLSNDDYSFDGYKDRLLNQLAGFLVSD
jgi:glycosyltransferase involved in cell wall biosynthesis